MSIRRKQVLVDLSKTKSLYNGPGQFCIRLGNELQKLADEEISPVFLIGKNRANVLPTQAVKYWKSNLTRDKAPHWLKRLMVRLQPQVDLWHITAQDSDFWPLKDYANRKTIPTIVTIHDLNFLREKSEHKIERRLKKIQARVDRAQVITTISNFSASEIRKHLNIGNKTLLTIYNGGPDANDLTVEKPSFLEHIERKKFLFTLGELTAKKNVHTLLPLLKAEEDYHLVIAGKNNTDYGAYVRREIRRFGLEDRVSLPGTISDQERNWLYQHCGAFLFPSLTEGFGIPVLEAMQFGKPVFMSHSTSLPEIGGGAGFYWKSYEADSMIAEFRQGMQAYASNPVQFSQNARDRAAEFNWHKSAIQYWNLYKEVLGASQ